MFLSEHPLYMDPPSLLVYAYLKRWMVVFCDLRYRHEGSFQGSLVCFS